MIARAIAAATVAAGLIAPAVPADDYTATQVISDCAYSEFAAMWFTSSGAMCRGTGEDPTTTGGRPDIYYVPAALFQTL